MAARRSLPSQCDRRFPQLHGKENFFLTEISKLMSKIFGLSVRELTTLKLHSYFVTAWGISDRSIQKQSGQENISVKTP